MTSIPHEAPRRSAQPLVPEMWPSLTIIAMWLSVLACALWGPDIVTHDVSGSNATIPSAGIPYVIVMGQVVVDSGRVTQARPGRAVRAPIGQR